MVEEYSTTLNRAGQMTLPSALRNLLGVNPGDRVTYKYNQKTKSVTIEKEAFLEDRLNSLHASYSEQTKEGIKRLNASDKSVSDLRRDWEKSPAAKKYYREKYGVRHA